MVFLVAVLAVHMVAVVTAAQLVQLVQ